MKQATYISKSISCYLLTALCLLLVLCPPAFALLSVVGGSVTGDMELSFADYRAKEGGREIASASAFTQKYSLLWSDTRLIKDGRLGWYDMSFGIEWTALDFESENSSSGITTQKGNKRDSFKFLYEGEVIIAPGALPFRLDAYSFDNLSSQYKRSSKVLDSILSSEVHGDYFNGQTVNTGVTLVAGIRNGSYLGAYREVLSRFPRLFIDYDQVMVRDLETETPRHYLDKRLAFVSLNKKDNWFHYRSRRFEDYMNSQNNYDESQIILGTIDQQLKRNWIYLTNWLQISVDATYDQRPSYRGDSQGYALNAFSIATSPKARVMNYSNFSRSRTDSSLSNSVEIPVYATSIISPELKAYGQVIARKWEDNFEDSVLGAGYKSYENSLYLQSNLISTHWKRLVVLPEVEFFTINSEDRNGGFRGFGSTAQVRVESDERYNSRQSFFTEVAMGGLTGDGDASDEDHYAELHFSAGMQRKMNLTTSAGFQQTLRVADGSMGQPSNNVGLRGVATDTRHNPSAYRMERGNGYVSESYLYLENTRGRMRNHLSGRLVYAWMSDHPAMTSRADFSLEHNLVYSAAKYKASMKNVFFASPEGIIPELAGLRELEISRTLNTASRWSFLSKGDVRYSPRRAYDLTGEYEYSYYEQGTHSLFAEQSFDYNIYTSGGMVRRLANFEQKLSYENSFGGGQETFQSVTLFAGAHYYPIREWRLGAYATDNYLTYSSQHTITGGVSTSLTFSKFMLDISYQHGLRTASDNTEKRAERRIDVTIKKIL